MATSAKVRFTRRVIAICLAMPNLSLSAFVAPGRLKSANWSHLIVSAAALIKMSLN